MKDNRKCEDMSPQEGMIKLKMNIKEIRKS
jgi:hypothetical protein